MTGLPHTTSELSPRPEPRENFQGSPPVGGRLVKAPRLTDISHRLRG